MATWKQQLKRKRSRRRSYNSNRRSVHGSVVRKKRVARLAKLAFIFVVLGFLGLFVVFPLFSINLPSPDKIVRREGFSTKIYDREGELLYDIFTDQRRTPVEFKNIPEYLKLATISIEDKNFYTHGGFDPLGMLRGFSRLFTRGYAQGGSTLTQQLVKNVLLTPERSITRKIREFVLSVQIETRYSKDEILQMYLNEAPYGGTAWGVQSAAETYFGKEVGELNLVESAFLAGLPQRPSVYSPYSSTPDAYVGRTEQVLRRMREDDYITRDQEEEAKGQLAEIEFLPRGASFKAPHFVQYVQNILVETYGERVVEQGGLKVTTTLDLELQEEAQKIVSSEIEKVKELNIGNGAAIVIDPETGEILAMVGSKDFGAEDYDGQVNVTTSLRQPGSAIKPITYVTALKKGYTASTLIMDVPTTFPGGVGQPDYEPVNYDGEYIGPVQMRYALGNSINVPAVKMIALTGIEPVLQTAYDLGLSSLEPTQETLNRVGLSLTLGGGEVRLIELTGAYSAFLNDGHRVEPVAVLKVEDQNGKTMEANKPKKGKRVISSAQAYIIADILSDNKAREIVFGLNSLLNIPGKQVVVKTGTTNDKRDNWAIGGTTSALVGVWVGNNDNSPMGTVASGISGASPIWRKIITEAMKGRDNADLEQPDSVVSASVDKVSGYRAHDGFEERMEIFEKGTEPGEDPVHMRLRDCDGAEKEFFVFKEEDPFSPSGGENRWQKGILEWIETQSDPRYHPPDESCDTGQAVINVEFQTPRDRDSDLDNDIKIRFSVDAKHSIENAELYVDGVKIRSFTGRPYEHEITLDDGVHELRAVGYDNEGNQSDRIIEIGVNSQWDGTPTPSPTPTPSATP